MMLAVSAINFLSNKTVLCVYDAQSSSKTLTKKKKLSISELEKVISKILNLFIISYFYYYKFFFKTVNFVIVSYFCKNQFVKQ
mgnify:CR=1 FL=1